MTKSRVESAVQELPPRGGRSKSDISALRPLDHLLRGSEKPPAVVVLEELNVPPGLLGTPLVGGGPIDTPSLDDASIEEASFEEPSIDEASVEEILFDEVVDEAELGERSAYDAASLGRSAYDAPGYYETSPEPLGQAYDAPIQTGEPGTPADESRAFGTFSEAAVQSLLDELRHSLSSALVDAERVLGEPERVALWFEMQARKRLLSLSARLSDELRATEVKKVLTSPPSKPLP
jgi:hypothetical protein